MSNRVPEIIVGGVVVAACVGLVSIFALMNKQGGELETTMFYACGYRAGQIAIISRLPVELQEGQNQEETPMCMGRRVAAEKGGFSPVLP